MNTSRLGGPILIVAVGTLLSASSAAAVDESCRALRPGDEDSPTVCREQAWFHATDTPLGNAGFLADNEYPTWSTTAPSGSAEDGQGAFAVGESYLTACDKAGRCLTELVFDGRFTGNLDSVAVSLHAEQVLWAFCEAVCSERDGISVALIADGHVLYETEGDWDTVPIEEGAVSQRLDFAFTDLYELLAAQGVTHPGFIHAIKLRIRPSNVHAAVVYRYDSVEFPSGLVFNPTPSELEGFEIIND